MVDGNDTQDNGTFYHWNFNTSLSDAGYKVFVKDTQGNVATYMAADLAMNEGIVVACFVDGKRFSSLGDDWPLMLINADATDEMVIGNVMEIVVMMPDVLF